MEIGLYRLFIPLKVFDFAQGFMEVHGLIILLKKCEAFIEKHWRRTWQVTPVFWPGKSHGQRSLAGYSPWDGKESDTTEATEY